MSLSKSSDWETLRLLAPSARRQSALRERRKHCRDRGTQGGGLTLGFYLDGPPRLVKEAGNLVRTRVDFTLGGASNVSFAVALSIH